jgi:DNA-binding transcriptional LysR family regulator
MARLDNVDLRLLRVFLAVIEARGFTAAQTQLNVSASTVSNQIAALETRLGVRLCQRGRAGFRLTPDGEAIYAEMQKLFAAIDSFDLRIASLHNRAKGFLAIGMVDGTISDAAAPWHRAIDTVMNRLRDLHITVDCRPPNELLREIMEGRLDVAIGSFPKILLGLNYVKLYDERHYFYCGRSHPLFDQAVTAEMLAGHPAISRGYWARRDTYNPSAVPYTAVVNTMEAGARLILSGRFMGYLPEHYAAPWVAAGEMRMLLPEELTYQAPFEIVHSDQIQQRRPARLFVDEVLALFGKPEARPALGPTRPGSRRGSDRQH